MNSVLKKFQKRLMQFDELENLNLWVLASGIGKRQCDSIYEYLRKSGYKMTFFTIRKGVRKEVKPSVVFPLGLDDRQWDDLQIEGNGLSFLMGFPRYEEHLSFWFSPENFNDLKSTQSLVKLMKGLSNLHNWNLELRTSETEIPLAKVFGGEEVIEFYSKPDTCRITSGGSLKEPTK